MGTSIQSGSDILGAVATASGFALLLIWGIFWLTGIRIRRQKLRFFSTLLMAVTLSILLGLLTEASSSSGGSPGGVFGNWVHVNCTLSGMNGLALALAWLAAFASILLATDWLFIEYITGALGLKPQAAPAGSPAGEKHADLFAPRPVNLPRPKTAPPKTAELPLGGKDPVKAVAASPVGAAVTEEVEGAPPEGGPDSSLPWWSKGGKFAQPETAAITTEEEEEAVDAEDGEEETPAGIEEEEEASQEVDKVEEEEEQVSEEQESKDEEELRSPPPPLPEAKIKPEKSTLEKTAAPSPTMERISEREPQRNVDTALLKRAIEVVFERRDASIALLLNCMNIGYSTAARLIYELEKCGVVTPPGETGLRKVLISPEELDRILEDLH